jgi:hypothetical protein
MRKNSIRTGAVIDETPTSSATFAFRDFASALAKGEERRRRAGRRDRRTITADLLVRCGRNW